MDTLITWLIAALVLGFFVIRYWRANKRSEALAQEAAARGANFSDGPKAQHPHIHADSCIGCGACVTVCPEGDVLALVGGKATIVNGHKCIGHGLCAEECPVGAITMVMARASASSDLPVLSESHETTVPNLFIAGELGGLALIKNAVNQGVACIDQIAGRIDETREHTGAKDVYDVIIAGAGPAGIAASLRAAELGLSALTLERETIGGTVLKYPRQKLVMTSPVEFPLHGKFRKTQLTKEELLAFWEKVMQRTDLNIHTNEGITSVLREANGVFRVRTSLGEYSSRAVILALGRAGTPRKLGVKGEELPHVLYRLIEADHYTHRNILVIGGGDSAVEAAMGLAHQLGNHVTLSYRSSQFSRLKDRNARRVEEHMRANKLDVIFNSNPKEFREGSVLLEVAGVDGACEIRELANDVVWIFAGGTSPTSFLKECGISLGPVDHDSVELKTVPTRTVEKDASRHALPILQ